MTRTTLNLDGPVLAELKRLQREEGKPLGDLASELLAAASILESSTPSSRSMQERRNVWYTYGMKKTTIYLPDELKKRLEEVARKTGRPEAAVIRDAISGATRDAASPRPRVPLTERGLGDSTIAENVDELLERFGR
jgi:hypothetical protein